MNKEDKIFIGAGWTRTGKFGDFISISLNGARDEDEFEIVAIRKADGARISLAKDVNVTLSKVKTKKSEKSPDFSLSVTPKTK